MNKIFTKEVKIAVAAILAVIVLFIGMNFLKGLTIFSSTSTYYMVFKDAKGISQSAPIYADGYRVGTVTDIIYDFEGEQGIKVEISVEPDLRIPAGSQAMIESDLMGNVKVNLLLANNPRMRIEEGGIIQGVEEQGALGQLSAMVPDVQALLPKIDSILTSVNMLLANPAIVQILANAQQMSDNLVTSTAQLNALMANVNRSMPEMMNHANGVMANTETLTNNLAAVDIAATMTKVNKTLDNVEAMTTALNNREGSLGLLMYDKQLYNNLSATAGDADSLLIDLKAHPKRYVHFSIFGKKDN